MKTYFLASIILLLGLNCFGQKLSKMQLAELQSAFTIEKADLFKDHNPNLQIETIFVNSFDENDLTRTDLLRTSQADLYEIPNPENGTLEYYKIFDVSEAEEYHIRTIFFDGKKKSIQEIDSIRNLILSNIAAGASFESQYKLYNMDDRKAFGDMGWIQPSILPEPFASISAIQTAGKVYSVDVPYLNLFYVAQNLAGPVVQKRIKVLKVTTKNKETVQN